MHNLTQTEPNCWQVCVAMLLDCAPNALPDQLKFPDHASCVHALRVYLRKHCGDLTYVEVGPALFPQIALRRVFHIIIGEAARPSTNGVDAWHAIVGFAGRPYWDVHPSRAGLAEVVKWGLIIPFGEAPREWREDWERREVAGEADMACVCPACRGSGEVRRAS